MEGKSWKIHASEQQKECCKDDTRPLTHDFVSATSTQKFFKTGYKKLDTASLRPGEAMICKKHNINIFR